MLAAPPTMSQRMDGGIPKCAHARPMVGDISVQISISYPVISPSFNPSFNLVSEVTHVFCAFYFCVTENTWEQLINHVDITFDGPWPTCSPWILWLLPT